MSKKLLMGLAPMLAALAAMPGVAQAVPHYYKNHVLIPEGERVPVTAWGKLTVAAEPMIVSNKACENITGGYVENPVGGGAGIGATLRFATYNCIDLECHESQVEIEGKKYELEEELISPPQSMPWPSELEEVAGVVRNHIKGQVLEISCPAHKLTRAEAGEGGSGNTTGVGSNEQFATPAGGNPFIMCVANETHAQTPKYENGTSAANPTKLTFGEGGGGLACNEIDETPWEAKTKESLKLQGYKSQEVITVH